MHLNTQQRQFIYCLDNDITKLISITPNPTFYCVSGCRGCKFTNIKDTWCDSDHYGERLNQHHIDNPAFIPYLSKRYPELLI